MLQDGRMLVVHVHARIRPDRVEDFVAAALANAGASVQEPGVLRFDVIQDQADPAHVVLVEVYRDADASAADKETRRYAIWRDAVAEMMAEPRASTKFSASHGGAGPASVLPVPPGDTGPNAGLPAGAPGC
jgi:autoinducer 2-degrading protein